MTPIKVADLGSNDLVLVMSGSVRRLAKIVHRPNEQGQQDIVVHRLTATVGQVLFQTVEGLEAWVWYQTVDGTNELKLREDITAWFPTGDDVSKYIEEKTAQVNALNEKMKNAKRDFDYHQKQLINMLGTLIDVPVKA